MSGWEMYWLVTLDGIITMAGALLGVAGVGLFIILLFLPLILDENIMPKKHAFTAVKWMAILAIASALVVEMVPNTKQMAVIIVAPKLINAAADNDRLMQLPDKVIKLADDWIAELSPKDAPSESK